MSLDVLTTAVLDLAQEAPDLERLMCIGGGFGLYLKQKHLEGQGDLATIMDAELWPPRRATEDVDLLLAAEVVGSVEQMQMIRAALTRLGYEPLPNARFFQFKRTVDGFDVKFDLLTCIPPGCQEDVRIKGHRVRPKARGVELHAYQTPEAIGLDQGVLRLSLEGRRSNGAAAAVTVQIPSPFTYLLMKLHAFRDRKDRDHDVQDKAFAAHHALDTYRIVAMMSRGEYDFVRKMVAAHAETQPVQAARQIITASFRNPTSEGMLRAAEGAKRSGLEISESHRGEFADVLGELFGS